MAAGGLFDGGEARPGKGARRHAVETENRDVLGAAAPGFAHRHHRPERHQVVGSKDADVLRAIVRQDATHRCTAAFDGVFPLFGRQLGGIEIALDAMIVDGAQESRSGNAPTRPEDEAGAVCDPWSTR